jgi:hypothetical protein
MRRRRRVKPSGGVQMFSFLDAMICTMGALLVLLHAFARHGQIEVAQKAEARTDAGQLKAQREDIELRIAQMKQARAHTEADLAAERLKLSHVEDHERRLREKLRSLSIAAGEMNRLSTAGEGERRQALAELESAKDAVQRAREAADDARKRGQGQASAYSVVPYDGPNATRRRPIYIECRGNAVLLQPEGVELVPEDFAGMLGPGNPLAAALRATREYLARLAAAGDKSGEPYPLLLVRPDGIESYYAARAALDSWGSEFGYELVGADWTLKFSEPDPQLIQLTRQVVAEARLRQQEYLASMPHVSRNRNRPTYHASSRGGFTREPGSRGSGGSGSNGWDSLGSNWARRRGTAGDGIDGNGDSSGTSPGPGGTQPGSDGRYGGGDGPGGMSNMPRDQRGGLGAAGGSEFAQRGQGVGDSQGGPGGPGASPGGDFDSSRNGTGSSGSRQSGGAGSASSRYDTAGSQTGQADGTGDAAGDRASGAQSSTSAGSQSRGANQASGSQGAIGSRSNGSRGGATSGSSSSSSAGADTSGNQGSASGSGSPGGSASSGDASSQSMGGQPSASFTASKKHNSMAKSRGRDWGLPEAGPAAVAATRPIAVECYNDRLVILPEASNEAPREIRLGANTQESMDELVSNVWQHMKGWGIAGKGMYWRPTLWVDVKPGAADRYADMKTLLAESGLDVRERQPRPTANRPLKQPNR